MSAIESTRDTNVSKDTEMKEQDNMKPAAKSAEEVLRAAKRQKVNPLASTNGETTPSKAIKQVVEDALLTNKATEGNIETTVPDVADQHSRPVTNGAAHVARPPPAPNKANGSRRASAPVEEPPQPLSQASVSSRTTLGANSTAGGDISVQSGSTPRSKRTNSMEAKCEIVTKFKKLDDLPRRVPALPVLTKEEKEELEVALQLDRDDPDEWWRDDWSGNLALMQKEISNPSTKRRKPNKTEITQTLWEWVQSQPSFVRLGRNLLALVYPMAPPTAQKIIGHASSSWEQDPARFDIFEAVKRCSFDPAVLREDGWTTSPQAIFEGSASGGPKNIGKEIFWQGYDAVVIAYVHDNDFGDLWKAMWLDAFETFDLEAEELQQAVKKWERKHKKSVMRQSTPSNDTPVVAGSARFAAVKDFSVEGIEHGIVLATTYNPNARQGVFWPARVLHVSELDKSQTQNKRNSAKQKVNVVFLAPYWNAGGVPAGRGATESSGYPLFEMESIDVSDDTIQKYPHDGRRGLNIHQLRVGFRFTGLPKNAFGRFLDSHRLAMALKLYAQDELMATSSKSHHATAALFDTHALAINTPRFPNALLNLPFLYVLSKLKSPRKQKAAAMEEEDMIEPTLQLAYIMKSMEPPRCYGREATAAIEGPETQNGSHDNNNKSASSMMASPASKTDSSRLVVRNGDELAVRSILSSFLEEELAKLAKTDLPSASLFHDLERLVVRANRIIGDISVDTQIDKANKNIKLKSLLQECLRMKSYGEDTLAADGSLLERYSKSTLAEWRKTCERLFKNVTLRCSSEGFGSGVTVVLSDSRCNQHITKSGCVERAVRLPAALKGAKLAGAGASPSFPLQIGVEDHYMKLATDKFLEKTHTVSYLKKIKARCTGIAPDVNGAHLTEASDGEGGCDTTGSRGTYDAAVAGVAAAMKAVDLIVGGHCVNAFCATRPPGHHAGRDLHPMGAVSNGFCVLNPVACAAIYATTPPSEGGLGLKRAVVIDFDVHHGNGTQDILCSTYDPRFLYVSMHAGGAHINGYETDDSDPDFPSVGRKKQEGIYPGRCGDTSPHKGVLNLPLGARVTPHDVGNALVTVIEPAIEAFSPDIIILSAGFDGHKNDPLGMGGLSAHDFGHITEVACGMAFRFCSGRIMSVLEGGYGVPCCRPQKDMFLPAAQSESHSETNDNRQSLHNNNLSQMTDQSQVSVESSSSSQQQMVAAVAPAKRPQPSKLMDLEESLLPDDMDDQVTPGLQRKLEKCHTEGFVDCVREHVTSLRKNNSRS